MKSIPLPQIQMSMFLDNLFNFQKEEKINRFKTASGLLLLFDRLYAAQGRNHLLHEFPSGNLLESLISKKELTNLYNYKLVKENGRPDYLALKKYTSFDYYEFIELNPQCPYCLVKNVEQLDHYLPKDLYPLLSVSTLNLIPSCSSCNTIKKTLTGKNQFIHPFFDEISDFEWLFIDVKFEKHGIFFECRVNVPLTVKHYKEYQDKLEFQMDVLTINSIYNVKAIELHYGQIGGCINLMNSSGEEVLRGFWKGCYESSKKMNPNSCDTAFYRALYNLKDIEKYLSYSSV